MKKIYGNLNLTGNSFQFERDLQYLIRNKYTFQTGFFRYFDFVGQEEPGVSGRTITYNGKTFHYVDGIGNICGNFFSKQVWGEVSSIIIDLTFSRN